MEPISIRCLACDPELALSTDIIQFLPCAHHQPDMVGEDDSGVVRDLPMPAGSAEADGADCRLYAEIFHRRQ